MGGSEGGGGGNTINTTLPFRSRQEQNVISFRPAISVQHFPLSFAVLFVTLPRVEWEWAGCVQAAPGPRSADSVIVVGGRGVAARGGAWRGVAADACLSRRSSRVPTARRSLGRGTIWQTH